MSYVIIKQFRSGHVDTTNISNCYNQDLLLKVLYCTLPILCLLVTECGILPNLSLVNKLHKVFQGRILRIV